MKRKEEHIRGFAHRMTYEEYQELEATVTEMYRQKVEGDLEHLDPSQLSAVNTYPTVEDLKEWDVFCHLSKYLKWLVFLDANDLKLPEADYKAMKKYVRRGLSKYIILI